MSSLHDLSKSILVEGLDFMLGDCLGEGITRRTYRFAFDPKLVIKIENRAGSFQNVHEWNIWDQNSHYSKVSKWLAPCRYISASGGLLIMDYARDLTLEEVKKIKRIPDFMVDTKTDNFGMIGDRVVLRDYGTTIVNLDTKLKKAEIW